MIMTQPQTVKRIVFILPRLYPGGAERVLISLMNNLDKNRYKIDFISLTGEGTIRHWIDDEIPIHALNKNTVYGSLTALYTKLKELKPDVVVTTMIQTNLGLLLLKPFFPNTRFIIRESSMPSAMIREYGLKGRLCRYIYKYIYPRADVIICPAEGIVNEFKHDLKVDTSRYRVLYNPVNERQLHETISDFNFDQASRLNTVHFVCVGRLGYEKGYDRLIEALVGFHMENNLNWRLDIIGKGAETKKLGELIRHYKLQDHIFLAGYQNTPWPHIAQSDCMLLPSRWEGMPNVVLESLSCGTPVIAHKDAGGVTEISALAQNGDVKLAKDMIEFVQIMANVKPSIPTLPIQSCLPEIFKLKNVIKKFEEML
jgi:glycosyltransferase involved in cell wall biosynthesis